jgi:amino acid transporter
VGATIGAAGAAKARDYALAQAAEPVFGAWGVGITVAIAIIATLSGLLASLYAVSRLYAMLQQMHQAPSLPKRITHQPLLITAGLAIILTAFLDLSQIASLGALLYLTMDIAVQGGVIFVLHQKISARRWVPALAILLDLAILIPFTVLKVQSDLLTVVVAAAIALAIVVAQVIAVRRRTGSSANS